MLGQTAVVSYATTPCMRDRKVKQKLFKNKEKEKKENQTLLNPVVPLDSILIERDVEQNIPAFQ
jgi:hypothetical protein